MSKQSFTTGQVLTAAQMTSLQQTAMLGGDASVKVASYTLVAADAGTAVAMNSASTTTITVNSGLFAAGDTVFIQNRGAGVCTVTAGTATVACAGSLALPQNDAGILYFTSASAATFYDFIQVGATSPLTTKGDLYGFSTSDARIPIGANNTVLTADSSEALGLKWAAPAGGGGKVLQVVQGTTTTMTTIATKTFTDTTITATITPSAATSKILVLVSATLQGRQSANNFAIGAKLLRASTTIQDWSDYNYLAATMTGTTFCMSQASVSMAYLDDPNTTSATTYKVQGACDSVANTAFWQINSAPSQIILMEIGA